MMNKTENSKADSKTDIQSVHRRVSHSHRNKIPLARIWASPESQPPWHELLSGN